MHCIQVLVFALLAVITVPMWAHAGEHAAAIEIRDEIRGEIREIFSGGIPVQHNFSPVIMDTARRLYMMRQGEPLWWTDRNQRNKALMLQRVLVDAGLEGLSPRDYAAGLSASPPEKASARQIAEADVLLSAAFLRYISDINNGRLKPHEIDPELHVTPDLADPLLVLRTGLDAKDFAAWLRGLAPATPGYDPLRKALAWMRSLAATHAWPILPDGPKLEKGQRSAAIMTLRRQMALLGGLQEHISGNDYFDDALDGAVRAFQARHGLDVDGVAGRDTRRALKLYPQERIRQIILNMERLRWLDDDFGPRYVLVNIAGFELIAVNDNKIVIRSPVVVGREYRRTPIFSDRIINLVLSPSWTPPPRLAKLDVLPKIKANPAYLRQQGFRVFESWRADARELNPDTINWRAVTANNLRFRLRQEPGPLSALGGVRFSLTNDFGIYLHDTPHKELFVKHSRGFSSGCIRVQKAAELALFALDNDVNWPPARLAQAMISAKTEVVKLAKPLPVHIIYRTAWVDGAGALQFRDDIYGRDALLRTALKLDAPE